MLWSMFLRWTCVCAVPSLSKGMYLLKHNNIYCSSSGQNTYKTSSRNATKKTQRWCWWWETLGTLTTRHVRIHFQLPLIPDPWHDSSPPPEERVFLNLSFLSISSWIQFPLCLLPNGNQSGAVVEKGGQDPEIEIWNTMYFFLLKTKINLWHTY